MKPTTILLGLSLITNANSQSSMINFPMRTELLEENTFDKLGIYENTWLIQNSERPITVPNVEGCQQAYAAAAAACAYMAWNPPVYVACMTVASAAFAACVAAS